jgi:hypothetical protein
MCMCICVCDCISLSVCVCVCTSLSHLLSFCSCALYPFHSILYFSPYMSLSVRVCLSLSLRLSVPYSSCPLLLSLSVHLYSVFSSSPYLSIFCLYYTLSCLSPIYPLFFVYIVPSLSASVSLQPSLFCLYSTLSSTLSFASPVFSLSVSLLPLHFCSCFFSSSLSFMSLYPLFNIVCVLALLLLFISLS